MFLTYKNFVPLEEKQTKNEERDKEKNIISLLDEAYTFFFFFKHYKFFFICFFICFHIRLFIV